MPQVYGLNVNEFSLCWALYNENADDISAITSD